MVLGILLFLLLLTLLMVLLTLSARYLKVQGNPIADEIDNLLPQTQCGQCHFPGCRPYAEAIANHEAPINLCIPGGQESISQIATLLNVDVIPLINEGSEKKDVLENPVAIIDEQTCIGCTLCIQACPVDAILGCAKHMHTVISSECTGCELCVPPCPVDCIDIIEKDLNLYTNAKNKPKKPYLFKE